MDDDYDNYKNTNEVQTSYYNDTLKNTKRAPESRHLKGDSVPRMVKHYS